VLRFIGPKGEHLASPISQEVDFRLELPASCPPGGCPVAIFGHGLGATKETMLQVSDQFARRGIATIGVSAPWHGNWIAPLKVLLGAHRNLDLLHGLFIAHITRNLQLVQLLKQDLGRFAMPLDRAGGPIIKLRSDRILYIGQSMGGICGVATTALSPDIQVALFDVTGGAAVDLFFDSHVARMMRLPAVDMPGLTVAETLAVAPLAMYLFDDMDPLGFAPHLIRSPLGEARPRLIAQHAGRGDGLVPNWTTEKLARAIGLEILRGPEDAAAPVKPVRGPGLRYFKFGNNYFLAHLSLVTEK